MTTRLEQFRNKVRVKAMLTQEQTDLLSRDMWHCNRCGHDLHVTKFHFQKNGDLKNICRYCENQRRIRTYEDQKNCQTCR